MRVISVLELLESATSLVSMTLVPISSALSKVIRSVSAVISVCCLGYLLSCRSEVVDPVQFERLYIMDVKYVMNNLLSTSRRFPLQSFVT